MACAREALGTPRFSVVLDASLTRDRKSSQVLVDRIEAGRRMLHPSPKLGGLRAGLVPDENRAPTASWEHVHKRAAD